MTRASSRSEIVRAGRGPRPVRPKAVRVLKEDPDLAAWILEPARHEAVNVAISPLVELARGPWTFLPPADPASLGALILDGLLFVRVASGDRAHVELLGEGDVVSPWVGTGANVNVPSEVSARILSPLRLALLDRRFALRVARWPEIQAALMRRLITRARRLSLQAAINAVPRVEERLELTLWRLGDRLGQVTAQGILLRLPLTHELFAELVAAQRPSVTTALGNLERRKRLLRPAPHELLLRGEPPEALGALARKVGLRA